LPGCNFAPRLVELVLDLVSQLKPVLQVIVNPFPDRLDFCAGSFGIAVRISSAVLTAKA